MWVLLAISLGGRMMGIFGMIFGVPMFAVIYNLLRESVEVRLNNKRIDKAKPGELRKTVKLANNTINVMIKDDNNKKKGNRDDPHNEQASGDY